MLAREPSHPGPGVEQNDGVVPAQQDAGRLPAFGRHPAAEITARIARAVRATCGLDAVLGGVPRLEVAA